MPRPTDIELTFTKDYRDQDCLVVKKQKGKKLTVPVVLEAMEKQDVYGAWYMPIVFYGETADDLYDDGDCWVLYDADSINEKLSQDRYSEGYEDGMKDTDQSWKQVLKEHGWRLP